MQSITKIGVEQCDLSQKFEQSNMDLMGTCVVVVARFVLLVGCHAVPDQAQYHWVLAAVGPIDGWGLKRTEPSE